MLHRQQKRQPTLKIGLGKLTSVEKNTSALNCCTFRRVIKCFILWARFKNLTGKRIPAGQIINR